MIRETGMDEIRDVSNKGPQVDKTKNAQLAVDEFLASGLDACAVEWRRIDDDFDAAKRAVAYRISHSKFDKLEGSDDLAMRSNRAKGEIYLIHSEKVDGA